MISSNVQELQEKFPEYIAKVKKNYRWNFIALVLDTSIYSFSIATLSQDTIVPYFVNQLTDQKWVIGMVPAIFYLGYFLPQLVGAYLVNGKSRRKWTLFKVAVTERIGILIIALVAQMYGWLDAKATLVLFLAAYLIFSVTNGMMIPGYSDFISKNIIRDRGLFFGFFNGISGLVGFGASLVIRSLLDSHSFPTNIRMAFWIGLSVSAVSPLIIASFKETPFPVEQPVEPLGHFIRAIPGKIRNTPAFIKFIIPRAVFGLTVMGNAFYALYALQLFPLSAGSLAVFMMIILLTQSAIGFLWGWIGDHYGYKIVYIISSVMMAGVGLLALIGARPWIFYLIAFSIGGQYAAIGICDSNMIFEIAPPEETSRFIGISNTLVSPIMVLAPLIGGLLIDIFSHTVLFSAVIVIGIVSIILMVTLMPGSAHFRTEGES